MCLFLKLTKELQNRTLLPNHHDSLGTFPHFAFLLLLKRYGLLSVDCSVSTQNVSKPQKHHLKPIIYVQSACSCTVRFHFRSNKWLQQRPTIRQLSQKRRRGAATYSSISSCFRDSSPSPVSTSICKMEGNDEDCPWSGTLHMLYINLFSFLFQYGSKILQWNCLRILSSERLQGPISMKQQWFRFWYICLEIWLP